MVWEGRGRPASASGLLILYVSRIHDLVPEYLLGAECASGCVQLETAATTRESLSVARDLALGMGLSVLEPGWRSHVSILKPTLRLCRMIIRVLHSGECAGVELSHEDVRLTVSCAPDGAFRIAARAREARMTRALMSLGFLSDTADRYRMTLGREPEEVTQILLRLLQELQHETAALEVVLSAPRPRRVL